MAIQNTDSIDLLTGTSPAKDSAGVTADTTGGWIDVSEREQIIVHFKRSNHTSGNSVFSIDGSNTGETAAGTYVAGLAVQDLTATASTTFVTSKTLNSASSAAVKVPAGWRFIRAVLDVTTDGTSFAYMEAGG